MIIRGRGINYFSDTAKMDDQKEFFIKLTCVGFLSAAPTFKFSPFPLVPSQSVLVSFPTMLNLTLGL